MRKITEKAIYHFNNDFTFSESNTTVKCAYGCYPEIDKNNRFELAILSLHGNDIAIKTTCKKTKEKRLFVTNCGWFSNTTKERLNGLPNVNIYQRDFKWYLNGKEWNGELTEIKPINND